MSVSSDETLDDPLQDSLIAFTGCIGEALVDICSYGLTMGESYVPFDPDDEDECGEDEAACSQAWVRVAGVHPAFENQSFDGSDCSSVLSVDLEVGVLRCIEIPSGGEAPTASQVLLASLQSMEDMRAIYCAALGCDVWDTINAGAWTPSGPLGGQYGGIWTFSVDL
jgi:hypothetical protein